MNRPADGMQEGGEMGGVSLDTSQRVGRDVDGEAVLL
jgi:hypothetical protein